MGLHQGLVPFCAVNVLELLEHDLDFLAIRSVHGDEMKALVTQPFSLPFLNRPVRPSGADLGVFHRGRRLIVVE